MQICWKRWNTGKKKIDIIIADRGIFDALCWFNWLNTNPSDKNPYLSNENFKELTTFINNDIWKRNIDLIYVFIVGPKTSIEREYSALLTGKRGSIMREDVLETYIYICRASYYRIFTILQTS